VLQTFLDFRDEALMEPFSEQHCRNLCLVLCCQKTGRFFYFILFFLENARILCTVSARLYHMSGCVATLYQRQSILPCYKSWHLFCTFVNVNLFGHFLSKQACFFTAENLPRIEFSLLDNFVLSRLLPQRPMQLPL
jgi:hypothetical protein